MSSWAALSEEVAAWRDSGRTVTLWWRDDDAKQTGPALDRLLALAKQSDVPLALSVVGGAADEDLGAHLLSHSRSGVDWVLVHGFRHINHADDGEKKSEFPEHRIVHEMLADVALSREALTVQCGVRLLAVFVPPWNRIADVILPRLPNAYFHGLSRFGPRASVRPVDGIVEVNTHVDLVAWRGERGFVGEDAALAGIVGHLQARRKGCVDVDEPTGILTHHAIADEAGWRFLGDLFERSRAASGLRWLAGNDIFEAAS